MHQLNPHFDDARLGLDRIIVSCLSCTSTIIVQTAVSLLLVNGYLYRMMNAATVAGINLLFFGILWLLRVGMPHLGNITRLLEPSIIKANLLSSIFYGLISILASNQFGLKNSFGISATFTSGLICIAYANYFNRENSAKFLSSILMAVITSYATFFGAQLLTGETGFNWFKIMVHPGLSALVAAVPFFCAKDEFLSQLFLQNILILPSLINLMSDMLISLNQNIAAYILPQGVTLALTAGVMLFNRRPNNHVAVQQNGHVPLLAAQHAQP